MATENQLYKPLAQRENDYERFCARLDREPKVKLRIGFNVTVLDESPDKIIFKMVDEWGQSFDLDEPNIALLEKVCDHIFNTYKGELLNNSVLIRIAHEIDKFMSEYYPLRYTGRVRIQRGKKIGDEYRYRYVAFDHITVRKKTMDDIFQEILESRNYRNIMYKIDDAMKSATPEEKVVFVKMQNTKKLDEIHALAHDQLGEPEKATELRKRLES